ncbi:hypothetical protein, partial [Methylocystis sp.]|uniref:hypothetical protein n=1 Tax=Methylocystis sp. TaxID=1911079 RepID=UPI003D10D957
KVKTDDVNLFHGCPPHSVGCENIATLAHRDAVRRGHPLHQTERLPGARAKTLNSNNKKLGRNPAGFFREVHGERRDHGLLSRRRTVG